MHNQLPQKTEMTDVAGGESGYNSTVAMAGNDAIDNSVAAKAKSRKQFDLGGGPDDHQTGASVANDSNIMLSNSLKVPIDLGEI